jgi:hypothetical protein
MILRVISDVVNGRVHSGHSDARGSAYRERLHVILFCNSTQIWAKAISQIGS